MAPEAERVSTNLLVQERHSQHVNVNVTSNVNVPSQPSQATQLNPEARNRNLLNTMFKVGKTWSLVLDISYYLPPSVQGSARRSS